MRVECLGEPLLGRNFRIRTSQHLGDVGLGLVILNHAAGPAEIVADKMGDELDERLPVVEDFRFERDVATPALSPKRQDYGSRPSPGRLVDRLR